MKSMSLRSVSIVVVLAAVVAVTGCARKRAPEESPVPPPAPTDNTPAPTPPPAPPTSEPSTTVPSASGLQPAFFDFDSYTLRDDARTALDANAKWLRDNPTTRLTIEGHCDERGTVEYNQALGERRAQAARDYLTAQGIGGDRLTIISYGKERPFDSGHDEGAWAQNRRAHFVTGS